MRILIVNDGLERDHLSVPRLCFEQAEHLADRGHEVTVLGAARPGEGPRESTEGTLRILRLSSSYPIRFRAAYGLYNPQLIGSFQRVLDDLQPEIVHFHNVHTHISHYALVLARRAKARVFLTAHDVMLFWDGKLTPFDEDTTRADIESDRLDYRSLPSSLLKHQRFRYLPGRNLMVRRWVNRSAARVIAVGERLATALRMNGFQNVEAIHNGLRLEAMDGSEERVMKFRNTYDLSGEILLCGGRLSELKGTEQLLSAMQALGHQSVHLVLMGEGSPGYMRHLRERIRALALDERVTLTGWLAGDALRSAYQAADICVNPSLCFETLSMFNLEAGLAGKPVVSTFFGGASETVKHESTGLLVNPLRTEELTEALARLLDAPDEARRMGAAGQDFVRAHFGLDGHIDRLLDLYA